MYVGRTESTNPKYNPISVLFNRYKKDPTKYKALGDCIKQNGYSDFVFTVVKETTDDGSLELIEKIKAQYVDKSLNDEKKDNTDYFAAELELLKSW